MIVSMEPVLKRGYTAWDKDVLPADEFVERQAAVRELLVERGLGALVVVNYSLLGAMFEYADIAYLGGLQSGGVLAVLPDAEPALVTFGGGRELFFTREQTWVPNVLPGRGRTFEVTREILAGAGVAAGRIGVTGIGGMPRAAVERLRSAFDGYELSSLDAELAAMRLRKRPRELLALGIARQIAGSASRAGLDAFAAGGDNTAAMLEAERVARFNRARDVRVLASMGDGGMRPFEGRRDGRHAPLSLWVAVQYHGYWSEVAAMSEGADDSAARAAVDAMMVCVRPGATGGMVAAAGLAALPEDLRAVARQYGLGGTVGLDRCDGVAIAEGNAATMPERAVVSLTCFVPAGSAPCVASRCVVVTPDGFTDLPAVELV